MVIGTLGRWRQSSLQNAADMARMLRMKKAGQKSRLRPISEARIKSSDSIYSSSLGPAPCLLKQGDEVGEDGEGGLFDGGAVLDNSQLAHCVGIQD